MPTGRLRGGRRSWVRDAHLWASLVLGLPIALVSAAGVPVTYWFATDALAAPAFYRSISELPPLPIDRIVASARAASPGRIENVFLNEDGRVAIVSVHTPGSGRLEDIAIDRGTARVLARRWQDETLIGHLYDFHTTLLLGDIGRKLILALAIAMLFLLGTGLLLWWPAPGFLSTALSPRLRPGRRLSDLHSKLGLYAGILLAVAATTAALLSWPNAKPGPPPRPAASTSPTLPLQLLIDVAARRWPGWQPVNILDTDGGASPLRILMRRPPRLLSAERVEKADVDRSSGRLLETTAIGHGPADSLRSLHSGRALGEAGRLAMAIAAIAPVLLWVSGLVTWLGRARVGRR